MSIYELSHKTVIKKKTAVLPPEYTFHKILSSPPPPKTTTTSKASSSSSKASTPPKVITDVMKRDVYSPPIPDEEQKETTYKKTLVDLINEVWHPFVPPPVIEKKDVSTLTPSEKAGYPISTMVGKPALPGETQAEYDNRIFGSSQPYVPPKRGVTVSSDTVTDEPIVKVTSGRFESVGVLWEKGEQVPDEEARRNILIQREEVINNPSNIMYVFEGDTRKYSKKETLDILERNYVNAVTTPYTLITTREGVPKSQGIQPIPEEEHGLITSGDIHKKLMDIVTSFYNAIDIFGLDKEFTPDESGITPYDRKFMPNLIILNRDDKDFQGKYDEALSMGGVPLSEYTGVKPSDIAVGMLSTLQAPFFVSGISGLTQATKAFPFVGAFVRGGFAVAGGLFAAGAVKQIIEEPSTERKIFDIGLFASMIYMGGKVSSVKISELPSYIKSGVESFKDKLPGYKEVRLYTETGELRLYRHYDVLGKDIRSPFYLKGEQAVDFENLVRGYHPESQQMTLENYMGKRVVKIGEPSSIDVSSRELARLTGRHIILGETPEYISPREMRSWGYTRIGGEDIIIDTNVPFTKFGALIKAKKTGLEVPTREAVIRHELEHSVFGIKSEKIIEDFVKSSEDIKKPFDFYLKDNEVVISERLPERETKKYSINDIIKREIEEKKPEPFVPSNQMQLKLFKGEEPIKPITLADILKRTEQTIIPKIKTTAITLDDLWRGKGQRIWVDAEGNIHTEELEQLTPKEMVKRQYTLADITKKPLYDLTKPLEISSSEGTVQIFKMENVSRVLKPDTVIESPDIMYVEGSPKLLNLLLSLEAGLSVSSRKWDDVAPGIKRAMGERLTGDRIVVTSEGTMVFSPSVSKVVQGEVTINDVVSGEINISNVVQNQIVKQLNEQDRINNTIPIDVSALLSSSLQQQFQMQKQEQLLKTISEQEKIFEETPFEEKIKIKIPVKLPGTDEEESSNDTIQSYVLKLRSRQYSHGKRVAGRTYHPASVPLSFDDAMSLGVHIVGNSEKASFELEESAEKPRKLGREVPHWSSKIMQFNETKPDHWTELSRFRIDSPGELREITMKGIDARMRL